MVEVVVKRPGFYVTIPLLGSFRSPFRIKVPDKLVNLVRTVFSQSGIKDFEFLGTTESKKPEKEEVREKEREDKTTSTLSVTEQHLSELLRKVDNIYNILEKLSLKGFMKEVVLEKEGVKLVKEDEEVFIPTIPQVSSVDLNVKTSTKEDITSVVESLLKVKEEKKF